MCLGEWFRLMAYGSMAMILWTLQHPSVWERLERDGVYRCDGTHLCFPSDGDDAVNHAHYAYDWLTRKMEECVGPAPDGARYPIWAWYKQQGQADGKPDMRSHRPKPGEEIVRIKLDIPDWEVLLSDFDGWHFALNYWYLASSEANADSFDEWRESHSISL